MDAPSQDFTKAGFTDGTGAIVPAGESNSASTGAPRTNSCSTCGPSSGLKSPSYVYALGRIEPRFPSLAVQKEFTQAAARDQTAGLSDRQTLQTVLSRRENRYLARHLCWVFSIQGMETYIVSPRDPGDFEILIASLRPEPSPLDIDVLIGLRGPIAGPQVCNGLSLPIVGFDQIYSFDRQALLSAIPRPKGADATNFASAAAELFDRIVQIADNEGGTDEHRALNYLVVRYPAIYVAALDAFSRNLGLASVDVRPSALTGGRKLVEVIFTFTHRQTDVDERLCARVDVTEEFPFLVTKLTPYCLH